MTDGITKCQNSQCDEGQLEPCAQTPRNPVGPLGINGNPVCENYVFLGFLDMEKTNRSSADRGGSESTIRH